MMRRLYSALNLRRAGLALTSVSGRVVGSSDVIMSANHAPLRTSYQDGRLSHPCWQRGKSQLSAAPSASATMRRSGRLASTASISARRSAFSLCFFVSGT